MQKLRKVDITTYNTVHHYDYKQSTDLYVVKSSLVNCMLDMLFASVHRSASFVHANESWQILVV